MERRLNFRSSWRIGDRTESAGTSSRCTLAAESVSRSTFQRSRGIIVKRLAPFSLERSVHWSCSPHSLTGLRLSSPAFTLHARCACYWSLIAFALHTRCPRYWFASLTAFVPLIDVHCIHSTSSPCSLNASRCPCYSLAPLRSTQHVLLRRPTALPSLRSGHDLTVTQRAPLAHAEPVVILDHRDVRYSHRVTHQSHFRLLGRFLLGLNTKTHIS